MISKIYDDTQCALGEGPLWHPERKQLFWFDITRFRLHAHAEGATRTWRFDEHVSAAGWVEHDRLLIASETKLFLFDLSSGRSEPLVGLEADNKATRSNDGRADPWGGFWIGTMGKAAEPGLGAIYRYYRGELRQLYPNISISNAICFDAARSCAYFTDTPTQKIWRQPLAGPDGWPKGEPELFVDLGPGGFSPDGAVVDAAGNVWNAQWGNERIAAYAPDGSFLEAVSFNARHTSCPAFGGADYTTLYCTTARQGLSEEVLAENPENGMTFLAEGFGPGVPEPKVIL